MANFLNSPSFNQLTLTVTERCNQRCGYCYVNKTAERTMTQAVAERALDLLFQAAPTDQEVTVAFFGGEPFLVPDLMRRICEATLARANGRSVRFAVTTNGTAVDDVGLALIRDFDLRLAVSYDGNRGQARRILANGKDSRATWQERRPGIMAAAREALTERPLARMTVTPENVRDLAANVKSTFHAGFERIMFLPAFEARWNDLSLRHWAREQERLVTWLWGLQGAGRRGPDLLAWRGVLGRLQGTPRSGCGAGVRQLTVSPEGRFYPCYRTLYGHGAERLVLGDVYQGFSTEQLARFAALHPYGIRPEADNCETCPAAAGCGFFCPALGHLLLGDLQAVPRAVCQLTRIQVAICEQLLSLGNARPRRPLRRRIAAATVAAALFGGGMAACDRNSGVGSRDAGTDSTVNPGVCPVLVDAGPDGAVVDAAVLHDAAIDAEIQQDGTIGPGVCPVFIDGGLPDGTVSLPDGTIGPGVCPVAIDAGPLLPDGTIGPGVCPVFIDAGN